jgi:hypothetical protein
MSASPRLNRKRRVAVNSPSCSSGPIYACTLEGLPIARGWAGCAAVSVGVYYRSSRGSVRCAGDRERGHGR